VPLERELKLSVPPRAAAAIARALALPSRGRVLHSIYFDTPQLSLKRRRMALRLRRDGRRWLQTLKGERAPGVRNEWEMPLASPSLDPSRLPHLKAIAQKLRPVFQTRFTRRARMLHRGKASIEVALDRGYVQARGRRAPISELELELKSGSMRALRREADRLAERFSLKFASTSKAARGYRLAAGA
jgi:triphosphatase